MEKKNKSLVIESTFSLEDKGSYMLLWLLLDVESADVSEKV